MSNAGRHTKKTPETIQKLVDALEMGNTHKVSCSLAGISTTKFYEWMKNDVEFADTITRAQATAEAWHVENIKNQASSDWRASVAMIERRNPEEWGKKDSLKLQGDNKNPLFFRWSDEEPHDE